jgi:hypothetical protein
MLLIANYKIMYVKLSARWLRIKKNVNSQDLRPAPRKLGNIGKFLIKMGKKGKARKNYEK